MTFDRASANAPAHPDARSADPHEAIDAALRLMMHEYTEFPEGIEDAVHLSYALRAMIKACDLTEGPDRDAAVFIGEKIEDALNIASREILKIGSILQAAKESRGRVDIG